MPFKYSNVEVVSNDRGGVIADDYYWFCPTCGWESELYYYPDTIPASQVAWQEVVNHDNVTRKILPKCSQCQYYAQSEYLVCSLYPIGVDTEDCPDFKAKCQEEIWEPPGVTYMGEEIVITGVLSYQQKLDLLDTHPIFTGRCPECESPIPYTSDRVHYDCNHCGWKDDSL